jgi:hypothetical protein
MEHLQRYNLLLAARKTAEAFDGSMDVEGSRREENVAGINKDDEILDWNVLNGPVIRDT